MPAPRKRKVHTRQGIQGRRPRAFFLPMPREDADVLILRTRMMLERVRNGEVDRALVANLGQVVLLVNFVIAAGYGALEPSLVDDVEQQLGLVLLRADQTGEWLVPPGLADDLTSSSSTVGMCSFPKRVWKALRRRVGVAARLTSARSRNG